MPVWFPWMKPSYTMNRELKLKGGYDVLSLLDNQSGEYISSSAFFNLCLSNWQC